MTRTTDPSNARLGPYVFAFAAGAIALSSLAATRKATDDAKTENDKARAEIANKLLDRLTILYRAPSVRA